MPFHFWVAADPEPILGALDLRPEQFSIASPPTGIFLVGGKKSENLKESPYRNGKNFGTASNLSSCYNRGAWKREVVVLPDHILNLIYSMEGHEEKKKFPQLC